MTQKVDVLILGGGIAGTCLAWSLLEQGKTFVLIDDETPSTASRIAAGLVTPITGKRLNETYQWSQAFAISDHFYRWVEEQINDTVWYRSGAVRLLESTDDPELVQSKLKNFRQVETTWLEPSWFDTKLLKGPSGFFMSQASRLDTNGFLRLSHRHFAAKGMYRTAWVDLDEDVFLRQNTVFYRPESISAGYAICCRGIIDRQHRYFTEARFNPAQGDILMLKLEHAIENSTLHAGWWLTPADPASTVGCLDLMRRPKTREWLLGSTYQWRPLDGRPSAAGRDSLIEAMRKRVSIECEVIEHRAAIRPSTFDQKPFLGMHPRYPQLGMLNGLGAKGCYLAPWCASLMVQHLFSKLPIPKELQWNR